MVETTASAPDEGLKDPKEFRTTALEVILPAVAFGMLIALVVIVLFVKQRAETRNLCGKIMSSLKSGMLPSVSHELSFENYSRKFSSKPSYSVFVNKSELLMIKEFIKYPNNCKDLLKLVLPTIVLLAFFPVTIWMTPRFEEFFWPSEYMREMPDINDVIAAFLTPAGLVYAIGFGYALQDALGRMDAVARLVDDQLTLLQHCAKLVHRSKAFTQTEKRTVYGCLKDITVEWMRSVLHRERKNEQDFSKTDISFRNLFNIRQTCAANTSTVRSFHDQKTLDVFFDKLLDLETVMNNTKTSGQRTINILLWLFLEGEAFITFFGILFLRADSYRLELTLCFLTVCTISVFTYILADVDSPYHGAFMVDLRGFPMFLVELRQMHTTATRVEQQPVETLTRIKRTLSN